MIKGRFTMKYILSLCVAFSLYAQTSFITPMEYASSLYKNPRGIGCHLCHGDKGEGKIIAKYIHEDKQEVFMGSAINNLDYTKFYKKLNSRNKGMPRYFLTDKEIKALYFYLQEEKILQQEEAKLASKKKKK